MLFLVDEDLPRSLAAALRSAGYRAHDVREIGLRGAPDAAVFAEAQQRGAVLLSGDLGFGNIVQFPLGRHGGIVIAHFPNEAPASSLTRQVLAALVQLDEADFCGNLLVIEPGKVRIKRATPRTDSPLADRED